MTAPVRKLPVMAALAGAVALLALVLSQVQVRTDMGEFLPRGQSAAGQDVLDEVRSGGAGGLMLAGIDGAAVPELARISRAMAAALSASGLFVTVAGGEAAVPPTLVETLFAHRYLLADTDWSEAGLKAGMARLFRQLGGAAGPLAAQFGMADPPGAMLAALSNLRSSSSVRAIDGAWFAPDRDRALLLLQTKAAGLDVRAQEQAVAAVRRAFAAATPGRATLLLSGPALFSVEAAHAIRGDVELVSALSAALVAGLLWWRFRSPLVIAAIAAPVIASVALAALAVQLGFGFVHGVALGFGATMLGIAVDYPVLMIGHRKHGEPAPATRARIGSAFLLAVATATLGLGAMVFSGFPGLLQLGVFAAVGLVAAAALTWFGLPPLIVAANLAPVASGELGWLHRLERLRRWRAWAGLPLGAAVLYLLGVGGPRWQGDLAALSPVPADALALDRELRGELGAGDAGQFVLVRGTDPETVLEREEVLLPALLALRRQGAVAGVDAAALLLPSVSKQAGRAAAIPDRSALAARVALASAGLPFRPDAFDRFLDDAAASRSLAPITLADLAGTPLRARLEPLLLRRPDGWRGPMVLRPPVDAAALRAALSAQAVPASFVDMRAELGATLSSATGRAWLLLAGSGAAVLALLSVALRPRSMAVRVLAAVLAAAVVTVAALTAFGEALSLIHLIALQLVAGVGLDYALFFARRQLDAEERARTLRTLVTCNATTLLTFGLLAFCRTPLLRDIGVTVACGAVLALVAAFFVTGEAA